MSGKWLLLAAAVLMAIPSSLAAADAAEGGHFVKLFNGKDLKGFNTYLKESGLNKDPKKVFTVRDGVIRASGEDYGYIITQKEYENYDLKAELKWGEETHPPRLNKARDAGILFHVVGPDMVWPQSIEFQAIEGRTGEIILVGEGSSIARDGETKTRTKNGGSSRFARFDQGPWNDELGYRDPQHEVENPHGEWNQLELIADGGSIKYLVNGKVVNEGTRAVPSKGRIVFQSEGAEVFYRNIEIRELKKSSK